MARFRDYFAFSSLDEKDRKTLEKFYHFPIWSLLLEEVLVIGFATSGKREGRDLAKTLMKVNPEFRNASGIVLRKDGLDVIFFR